MSNAGSISADAFEILVSRELRRAGIEPVSLRRSHARPSSSETNSYSFDLNGRLQAYGRRWSALIECRNLRERVTVTNIDALRERADSASASSALLFLTSDVVDTAIATARMKAIPLLRIVDAQTALIAAGVIQAGQLPAWLPEFTVEMITPEGRRLLEADQPELILRELRPREQ
jgi:hypothetical protein